MNESSYVPGVCNINREEIAYRRKFAIGGLIVATVLFVGLAFTPVSPYIRALVILLPLLIGVISLLQVRNRFCVSYGASGKQHASEGDKAAVDVAEEEARVADKRKAKIMNAQAFLLTIAICLMSLFVPAFS